MRCNKGITIPFHTKDLRKGTLKYIIQQSGLSLDEFLKDPLVSNLGNVFTVGMIVDYLSEKLATVNK